MWSLGCIVVELFLGLPLFPGSSEYNQVSRITEMLGLPPNWMLEVGKQAGEFFEKVHDEFGRRNYRLKSMEQYSREHNTKEQPSKKYFTATRLPDIIRNYPMPRKGMKSNEVERGEVPNKRTAEIKANCSKKWPIERPLSTLSMVC
jgi:dual specificity protein kinase YAK1